MIALTLDCPANAGDFDEQGYLDGNPDVAQAVQAGSIQSGRAHFELHGLYERRKMRRPLARCLPLKRAKLEKLAPLLRSDLPRRESDGMLDYLSDQLRRQAAAVATSAVSGHSYDPFAREMIARYSEGWILDCGAGKRGVYYSNVVNFEIVPYDTTDVLGIGEELPFQDESFDAVFSLSVLEHVRDPFRCAQELTRVLKPGGELLCAVPFLQPLHGYPGHYFNMSHQGLRSLFEGRLQVESHIVPPSGLPVWTLSWMLNSWAAALDPETRRRFLDTRVSDLIGDPVNLLNQPFVKELPAEKNLELASMTLLRARKPPAT
jgi:SAM-dependent methyltransferase